MIYLLDDNGIPLVCVPAIFGEQQNKIIDDNGIPIAEIE